MFWGASQEALEVKRLPPHAGDLRDTVSSLGQEDPLEKGMATHSSILACRILMDRGAWRAIAHGVAEAEITECLSTTQHR